MSFTAEKIVTRFAPSPTGVLHIGSLRTALYPWLYARQHNGKFVLRIEDTDRERSTPAFEENILEGLKWFGIDYDEFYRQSERGEIYKKHIDALLADGTAYVSKEEPKEIGERSEVIRFKNPNRVVTFYDEARGDISFDTTELGDFVIAKDINTPLYHLAVVVDDFEMGITHIIRGDDGISNTPRQILLQEALGAPRPSYTHMPMILAPDKTKLSKRHGALGVTEYRDEGYLPEALINFVALMGWNPGTEQELLSREDMLRLFTLEKIQKGAAVWNIDKLKWFNKQYMKKLPFVEAKEKIFAYLPESLKSFASNNTRVFEKIVPIILDHVSAFGEVKIMAENGEIEYFFEDPEYNAEGLFWKNDKNAERTRNHLVKVVKLLQGISADDFTVEAVKNTLWKYASLAGKGNVLWPLRFALSGRDKSPDPFILAEILGREVTLRRIEKAMERIDKIVRRK
ncbi:MAG: glutamate--tRNA ligase [Candidatus Yonathbacteria bacterium]|nr:glutamate--tRNA ligase [Candidatus Yonathbacteria bacterium]